MICTVVQRETAAKYRYIFLIRLEEIDCFYIDFNILYTSYNGIIYVLIGFNLGT